MPSKPIAHVPGVPYSSHNLSHTQRFTTRPGVLKPVLIDELVPGARYRLDIGMIADTFPTENPLFGTFEVHTDVFLCPLKNWYANWHTNFPGLDYTPDNMLFHYIQMRGLATTPNDTRLSLTNPTTPPGPIGYRFQFIQQFPALPDSMFDYLGFPVGFYPYDLAAVPTGDYPSKAALSVGLRLRGTPGGNPYSRSFCGHSLIAYYDIFRSYYINPQEENFLMYNPESVGPVYYDASLGNITTTDTGATVSTFATSRTGLEALYASFGLDDYFVSNTLLPRFGERYTGNIVLQSYSIRSLMDWLNTIYTSYSPDSSSGGAVDLINSFTSAIGPSSFGLPGAGFCVRTYRPDLLTSWMSQDGIEKVRTASSMKASSDGTLTFEQILTGQKVYDYTVHSQLSGGRYKDWVRSIYRVTPNMDSDQPILLSHSRTRMDFQGIYQNSSTESAVSPSNQRTALGGSVSVGQAQSVNDSIVFDCTQPSLLVVMNSVVPIADYSQGIDPMLLHTDFKHCYSPDYDGLGWQPLTVGMLAPQWDTNIGASFTNPAKTNDPFTTGIGYQPAWEEYRSRVNRVHGDFHDTMSNFVLQRVFPAVRGSSSSVDDDGFLTDGRFYSSYILPSLYTSAWAVKNGNPFRIQYAFGYRARLPMSKYSLPKLA